MMSFDIIFYQQSNYFEPSSIFQYLDPRFTPTSFEGPFYKIIPFKN